MSRLWGGKGNETKAVCTRRILQGLDDKNAVRTALVALMPEDRAALAILKEHGGIMQVGLLDDLLQAYGYSIERSSGYVFGSLEQSSPYVMSLLRRGYLLLVPRNTPYSPYTNLNYAGLRKGEFVYTDERFLRQIDWPLEVRPLPIAPAPTAPASPHVRRPQLVTLDLMAVTRALAEMKQLSLTKTGTIRVTDLRQFQQRMGWSNAQTLDGFPFPNIATAVITAWTYTGWLRSSEEALTVAVTPEFLARQPLHQQVSRLVNAFISATNWNELTDLTTYDLPKIRPARFAFVNGLRALPDPAQYYRVPDVMTALYPRVGETLITRTDFDHQRPMQYNITAQQYQQQMASWQKEQHARWLRQTIVFGEAVLTSWLYWLGVVEVGRLADHTLAFRLTDMGRALITRDVTESPVAAAADSPAWVVQPNYDIVVYLDAASPTQLAFLEQHAERRQAEAHTAHYQLTRESSYRGLQGGASVEDVLAYLRLHSRAELPQNVERELREWAGQREQMTIATHARIIEFPSPETRALALDAGLRGTALGETYVLVAAGAQIKAALKSVFGLQSIPTLDYVQPPRKCLQAQEDGRLTLTTATGDLLLHGQLARCAEPLDATHWRLTLASLAAVRQAGVTPATLLAFLQSRVQGALPPLLEIVIGNALGTREHLPAETAFVLRVTNKKLYTALTTSPLLKPYLLDIPGPDTILVSLSQLEEFKAQLDWLGVKLTAYTAAEKRPDWQQTVRDAKTQQRRRERY
jgi:hypothetical protein